MLYRGIHCWSSFFGKQISITCEAIISQWYTYNFGCCEGFKGKKIKVYSVRVCVLVHNNNSKKNIKLISSYYRKLMHYYYHCIIPLCFFIRASLLHASGWRGKDLNLCSGIMLTTISLGILLHVLPSYEIIHEKREAFHFHSFQFFHKFLILYHLAFYLLIITCRSVIFSTTWYWRDTFEFLLVPLCLENMPCNVTYIVLFMTFYTYSKRIKQLHKRKGTYVMHMKC